MLKKTITYTDYNDVERTEDFHFHLSKAELLEMEMGVSGGMDNMLQNIINAKDGSQLVSTFKNIILRAYGVKSPDGKSFIKTPEIVAAFEHSPAYSDLFMELASDAEAATAFITSILPKDMAAAAAQQALKSNAEIASI